MFEKKVLKNGLRVILVPDDSSRAVAAMVLVATGSRYENLKTNGLSHFLEHMLFKGTKKRPSPLKVKEALDLVGGVYNAFTSKEYTGYWAKVQKENLHLAIDWLGDIFLNSLIPSEELEREKGVIIEELNMYLDTPTDYVLDLWEELLYPSQPLGWPTIGRKENILGFQRSDFLNYLRRHYVSRKTVVAVAGNFNQKDVLGQIEQSFANINRSRGGQKKSLLTTLKGPQVKIHFKKTDQTHLCFGVLGYDMFHPRRYALSLLSVILGGNMSSRLFEKVREKMGAAYYISTFGEFYTDTGYLATHCGVPHNLTEKVLKTIAREYQRIRDKGVSKRELRKAKDFFKGRLALSLESSDSRASFFAFQELFEGKIRSPEEKIALIEKVTREDVQRVAREIFKSSRVGLALIGPHKDDKLEALKKIISL